MEGDEEIVRAESILGERKKHAYIFPDDEASTHENILRNIMQIYVTNTTIYLRGIVRLLQKIREFINLGNMLHYNVSNITSIRINFSVFSRIEHKFSPDLFNKKHVRLIAIMRIISLIIYR